MLSSALTWPHYAHCSVIQTTTHHVANLNFLLPVSQMLAQALVRKPSPLDKGILLACMLYEAHASTFRCVDF